MEIIEMGGDGPVGRAGKGECSLQLVRDDGLYSSKQSKNSPFDR